MSRNNKLALLMLLSLLAMAVVAFLKPIPQDPSFHHFADTSHYLSIPNCLNVITNIPFVLVGLYGLIELRRKKITKVFALIYSLLFTGIVLTGLGSAYYHLHPSNDTLLYDRMPMTIVFMSFLCAIIAQCINQKAGYYLVVPMVLIGISSVLWWHFSELNGRGDLRFYGFVQFYPIVFIPLILFLFYKPESKRRMKIFLWIVGWYIIAKLFERYDHWILETTGIVSGHSIKHLAAAVSTWLMVVDLRKFVYLVSFRSHQKIGLQ